MELAFFLGELMFAHIGVMLGEYVSFLNIYSSLWVIVSLGELLSGHSLSDPTIRCIFASLSSAIAESSRSLQLSSLAFLISSCASLQDSSQASRVLLHIFSGVIPLLKCISNSWSHVYLGGLQRLSFQPLHKLLL